MVDYDFGDEIENSLAYYSFYTNIRKNDVEKIYLRFKIDKEDLYGEGYYGVKFFIFDESWHEINLNLDKENDKYLYYSGFVDYAKGLAISGYK